MFEGLEGRPAPWTAKGEEYDKLGKLRSAAINKQLDDLNRPATTAQQRAADYTTEGKAIQALSDQALGTEVERRLKLGQGMAGIQGTLQAQETRAIRERTGINTDAFTNRTNVLTQAELQRLDAATRNKEALIRGMSGHELAVQGNQLDFGREIYNNALASAREINQMLVKEEKQERLFGNILSAAGLLAAGLLAR